MTEPLNLYSSYGYRIGECFVVVQSDSFGALYSVYEVRSRPRNAKHLSQKVAEFRSLRQARLWSVWRNDRHIRAIQKRLGGATP